MDQNIIVTHGIDAEYRQKSELSIVLDEKDDYLATYL